jgi:predicted MPP superfamily phosphohydrolase
MKILRRWMQNLEIGSRRPLLVRREEAMQRAVGKRILFASDLHFTNHAPPRIIDEIIGIACRESPDIVLLGGDLVDSTEGAATLRALVEGLSRIAPVGAVAGNHDRWIGKAMVRAAVLAGGGSWLEDAPLHLGADCVVCGSQSQESADAKYQLLCTHHPGASVFRGRFHLTLSGHLHGGQFVFFERGGRLFPGAFLYRWNGLRFDRNGRTLLVSRGVQDTLPLRWNCPREVLLVDM